MAAINAMGLRPSAQKVEWFFILLQPVTDRTTQTPIFRRTQSGYLRRALSANFLVLNGFDMNQRGPGKLRQQAMQIARQQSHIHL
jgi:hypothetical protein